ncbi:MAG: formyltransferase family protein, partial [Bacteroidota bacterium]
QFKSWFENTSAEVAFCLTFPHKLCDSILSVPSFGILNFHFGSLPEYRGPEPLFWILKNGERVAPISVHKMVEQFDAGPVIHRENVNILPGENYGLLGSRLGIHCGQIVETIWAKIQDEGLHIQPQNSDHMDWKSRPNLDDVTIKWDSQSAEEIEQLVNACNPKYGGAITYFRQSMVRILEVSPADVNNAALLGPGMIVYSDAQHGIFVLCSDNRFLRINLVRTPEAFLSGGKLAALGVRQNEKFTSEQPNLDVVQA